MPRVTFGNTSPITKVAGPDGPVTVHSDHIAATESWIDLPASWVPATSPRSLDGWARDESFRSITHPGGWWSQHSAGPPAWVECPDWPELEAVLRLWYGAGPRPAGWRIEIADTPALRVDTPQESA